MNISFSLTTPQVRARKKDVTRRIGWWRKRGLPSTLTAIEKGQGLKKGEKIVKICDIYVESVTRERLDRMITDRDYGLSEVVREGFPNLTPSDFVDMFCRGANCTPDTMITRIQFSYL